MEGPGFPTEWYSSEGVVAEIDHFVGMYVLSHPALDGSGRVLAWRWMPEWLETPVARLARIGSSCLPDDKVPDTSGRELKMESS